MLEKRDYEYVNQEDFFRTYLSGIDQRFYTRQCETGKTIYGKDQIIDLMLYHPRLFPHCLTIEGKWQTSPGSVDEKYPLLVLNIAQGSMTLSSFLMETDMRPEHVNGSLTKQKGTVDACVHSH